MCIPNLFFHICEGSWTDQGKAHEEHILFAKSMELLRLIIHLYYHLGLLPLDMKVVATYRSPLDL